LDGENRFGWFKLLLFIDVKLDWCCWLITWLVGFQPFDSFDDFDSMQSHFYVQIIFEVGISNEIEHRSVKGQVLERLFVLRKPQMLLQPKHGVLCGPEVIGLSLNQYFTLGYTFHFKI
jgi:hypothetical protein